MSARLAMSPRTRRVVQALLYEAIAVAIVAPVLSWVFDSPPWTALALTLATSAVALAWNFVYNSLFERWESRQPVRGRSAARRLAHSLGFEVGLVVLLVPLIAWWLGVTLLQALIADIGLMVFFFFYTMVFTWGFDRVFGLPASATLPVSPAAGAPPTDAA
jgi:uncharacterized membrane protein